MRPLMVPDPVCASCHGSFVERMENPRDDPREFTHTDYGDLDGPPPDMDTILFTLQSLMDRGMARPSQTRTQNSTSLSRSNNRMSFQISGPNGSRTVTLGGINTLGDHSGPNPASVPTMSEFLGPNPQGEGGARITGPLIAQYLAALLGQHDPLASFFGGQSPGGIPENGRMGDYVFNQEALDQIITQIMEGSNAHRPVPATDEIIDNLPREVLMVGSATLQNDCAVCKDQFKLHTDDPDEQVVVTLPCKHPFHEPCIIPWLKSSGTCPVCRHALVPQPESHQPPEGSRPTQTRSSPSSPTTPPRSNRAPDQAGLFRGIFGGMTGQGNGANSSSRHSRGDSNPASRSPNSRNNNSGGSNIPGRWEDDLD